MPDLRMLKYPLFNTQEAAFDDAVSVQAPPSTGINFIGMQNGMVTLWSLVDIDMPMQTRTFAIAGTGHKLPKSPNYLGSVFDRVFVWHVFELFPEASRG